MTISAGLPARPAESGPLLSGRRLVLEFDHAPATTAGAQLVPRLHLPFPCLRPDGEPRTSGCGAGFRRLCTTCARTGAQARVSGGTYRDTHARFFAPTRQKRDLEVWANMELAESLHRLPMQRTGGF